MTKRIDINPFDLNVETAQLLADLLLNNQVHGKLLRRNTPLKIGGEEINLETDILVRKNENSEWCYDVMNDKSCGQGKFGSAHVIAAKITIAPPINGIRSMLVENKNKRVFKLQNNAALNEFKMMNRCSHLRTRGLFAGVPSLISMRKFDGEVLNDALNRDRKGWVFTADQRFKLTRSLLRGLKTQMHDNMICHRDVKPDNIFYNAETGEIMIFDLGSSQLIGDTSDKRSRGNATYSAPEDFISIRTNQPVTVGEIQAAIGKKSLATYKSDIYSMGRVLCLVWGDTHPIFLDKTADNNKLLAMRAEEKWVIKPKLPHTLKDVTSNVLSNVNDELLRMTELNPTARPELMESIQYFDQLYLNFKLQNYPAELYSVIKQTNANANDCFWKLNNLSRYHNLRERLIVKLAELKYPPDMSMQAARDMLHKKFFSKTCNTLALEIDQWCVETGGDMNLSVTQSLNDNTREATLSAILTTLTRSISELDDSPETLLEFKDTLDIQCLVHASSRKELLNNVTDILATYLNLYNEVMRLHAEFTENNNIKMLAEMKHFMATLSTYRLTIDDIHLASLHMQRKLGKLNKLAPRIAP